MAPKTKAKVSGASKTIKEKQKDAPKMLANKKMANKTSFKKGVAHNPTGKNGHTAGLQPYGKRVAHYLEKFTSSQIIQIASDFKMLDKFTTWDAIVIKNIAASLIGMDTRQEREAMLNRVEGKPKEHINIRSIRSVSDLSDEELDAVLAEDARRG